MNTNKEITCSVQDLKNRVLNELTIEDQFELMNGIIDVHINGKGTISSGEYSSMNIMHASKISKKLKEHLKLLEQILDKKTEYDEDFLRSRGL